MLTTKEIAWTAGFLEGEGSFGYANSPYVTAAQVQREPLDRLIQYFGGRIRLRTTRGFSTKPIWVWAPTSRMAVQIMMTVYPLMSPKRQNEIAVALKKWRAARLLKSHYWKTCGRGHKLEGHNAIRVGKYLKCRKCKNRSRRIWRAAKRAAA